MTALNDETARQRELDLYRILDTLPEAAYDDIVRLASILCDAPTALISLIDRDRQWFKARTGFAFSQTAREISFCDYAIREPGALMEVADARSDPRFASNPLVATDDGVRFYAGMPLVTPSGAAIGTICVLGQEPRVLDERQRSGLAALARLTMNLLESHHRERDRTRAAMLAAAEAAEPPAMPEPAPHPGRCLAIFELQDFAADVALRGERAVERTLQQLEQALEAALIPGSGDSVSRATGSPETLVVLHGDATDATLQRLCALLTGFERASGLRVLVASAASAAGHEGLDALFGRADAALSELKDGQRLAHAA